MKYKWEKKYLYWGITAFLVIVSSILFFSLLNRLDVVAQVIGFVLNLLMPFIIGLIIAYLLGPLVDWFEDVCFRRLFVKMFHKEKRRAARVCALIVTFLLAIALVAGLCVLVFPQLFESIKGIVGNLSSYFSRLEKWVLSFFEKNPDIAKIIEAQFDNITKSISNWATNDLLPQVTNLAGGLTNGVINVVNVVTNLIVGLVVSIYVLSAKEHFFAQTKKVTYAIFSIRTTNTLLRITRRADRVFGKFVKGKLIEALIIGLLCFVGMSIFGMPFATLISVIIGVTNIVPFFGPIVGAVFSCILILLVDPLSALYFAIFILILQQFDGNVIGPKILGDSTGLSSFWVIFSIMIFGGLFGFTGMIIGVPTFALIYSLVAEMVSERSKRNDMPSDTADYEKIDHITLQDEIIYRKPDGEEPEEPPKEEPPAEQEQK